MNIAQLIQRNYGSALACLIKRLGDIQIAEDSLQEACIAALQHWQIDLPDKPDAWLIKVATNKSIDYFRKYKPHLTEQIITQNVVSNKSQNNYEFDDAVLSIIFICCHPSISPENQLAITLKFAMGFHQRDIAKTLLISEKALEQRITRTKRKMKANQLDLSLPAPSKLSERLSTVIKNLYLIFNEGYHINTGNQLVSIQICEQAILMTRLLCRHYRQQPECLALLSLMLFSHARSEARGQKHFISLEEQDRSLYNKSAINEADILLQKSLLMGNVSTYHIEAAISGLHSQANNYLATDWQQICLLYEKLLTYHNSPVIQVNRAVAYMMLKRIDLAETILNAVTESLEEYLPYYAACAKLHLIKGNIKQAIRAYKKAVALSHNQIEIDYFQTKIRKLSHD